MTDTEEDMSVDVLTEQIVAEDIIVDETETLVVHGGMVCVDPQGDGTFTGGLGEETDGCIRESHQVDASAESCIDGCFLATGNHAVLLLDEDTALAHLTARKTVNGVSVLHLCFHTDENRGAEREAQASEC